MRFWSKKLISAGLSLVVCAGCGSKHTAAASRAAIAPPSHPVTLTIVAATLPATMPTAHAVAPGICFDYPCTWLPAKGATAIFSAASPPCPQHGCSSISLDIPHLPWHLPGMITLGMVAHGYKDDLKKNQIHDASVQEEKTLTIQGESARKVTCTGHCNGKPAVDIAVIMIHADKVYILSADCEDAGRDETQQAMDTALSTLRWTK